MKTAYATLAAAAVLLVAAPQAAHAYWGFGVGPSKIDIDCAGTLTCDRTDTGGRVYVGWHLQGPFGVEASVLHWGRAESTSAGGNGLKTRAVGLGAQAVWIASFGAFQCYARAGAAYNRASTDLTSGGTTSSGNHNLLAPHLGLSCTYPLLPGPTLTVGVDLSRVKYTSQDKANTQLFTIGLQF